MRVLALGLSVSSLLVLGLAPVNAAHNHGLKPLNAYSSYHEISVNDETLKGAETFVGSVADRGIGFLSDSNLSKKKRISSFRSLLKTSFDLPTIARFSLGRYWRTASETERKEYVRLFEKMIIQVYSNRFGEYNGEELRVVGSRAEGKRDILVNSQILPSSGQAIKLDWRVRYKNGKYKVVDVIVEGVSMALTQRSDFAAVIQRGGGEVNVLLSHLRGE